MVRSSSDYHRVLLCVYPDVDLIKSCDPEDNMFSSDDPMDREDAMDDCHQVNRDPQTYFSSACLSCQS